MPLSVQPLQNPGVLTGVAPLAGVQPGPLPIAPPQPQPKLSVGKAQTQPSISVQSVTPQAEVVTNIPQVVKGINGARLDGHSDGDILAQYIANHPESQAPQALADGHNPSEILDQILL